MKRNRVMHTARGLAALVALWAGQLLIPVGALAQETGDETVRDQRVVVEVRDGKVYVNGKETAVGESGRIVLRKGDGDEVVVFTDEDGGAWVSAYGIGPRARADAQRAREMARSMVRMHAPDFDAGDFVVEFEPPDLSELGDLELEIEGRLADVFELQENFNGNVFQWQKQSEELRELEGEIRRKAREVRRADENDRAALEAELDALVDRAFDLKLEDERSGITDLERRLEELRDRVGDREANRREIVERRKKDLLGRHDNLDW